MTISALFPWERPPRLHISRDRISVPGGRTICTEHITIMNEGGGILKGTARSDAAWIILPCQNIETPFIFPFRLEIDPKKIPAGNLAKGTVTIITNGGTAKITAEYIAHPEPQPALSLDDRELRFCNLSRGEKITAHLMVRNSGSGVLSGTIDSESDWIEVKKRTIWTQTIQAVQVVIHTVSAPQVSQPVGRIRIRSSGGSMDVLVSLHFRTGAAPRLRLDPPRIRCLCSKRGIIEEKLTIHNDGAGTLRGTIPSPVPWVKIIPSIFPVEKKTRIRVRIDTRDLPEGTLSIPVPVITNAGRDTLTVEVTVGRKPQAITSPRRSRASSRIEYHKRLIAYDQTGRMYTLISSGRSGGEGEIFFPAGTGDLCAKIFHPHKRTPDTDEKLRVMINNPPPPDLGRMLTWPEILLFDRPGKGRVIGYLMRRIPEQTFRPVHMWYDEPQAGTDQDRYRIASALTLARIIAGIHRYGHSIGDLRENNLLINTTGDIILIDTDSFQIRDPLSGKVFWSRVGTAEYLPPEHLDGSFSREGCDRRYGDYFALAVLIFRFLMNGVHPFQAKGPLVRDAPATSDKILLGHFAFESPIFGIEPPDYAPPYRCVPAPVQKLFREAFINGHRSPKTRPDAGKWVHVLSSLIPVQADREKKAVLPSQKPERTEYHRAALTDREGNEIIPKRPLYQAGQGVVYETEDRSVLVYLLHTPMQSSSPAIRKEGIPPSVIMAADPVARGESLFAGWLIRGIDRGKYLPWHMAADPESRINPKIPAFSFRHRIACCRNFISALISVNRLNLPRPVISARSVYVGPDASVRILSLPRTSDEQGEESEETLRTSAILIFQMLMDGYHPYHATGSRAKAYQSPEKRMKAGLFPWTGSDPTLAPPGKAPPFEILPPRIRELFEEEFRENDGNFNHNKPDFLLRWFLIFDQTLGSLIRCITNPDHWYLPGLSGCPWCNRFRRYRSDSAQAEQLLLAAPGSTVLFLSTPRIGGLLPIPGRYLKRALILKESPPGWGVIPLPSERLFRPLLPHRPDPVFLPLMQKRVVLLIPWKRTWISCIPGKGNSAMVLIRNEIRVHCVTGTKNPEEAEYDPLASLSLIDEMILTSTMDRLRGEGIGMAKSRRRSLRLPRQPIRRTVDIVLYPLYIPWNEVTENKQGSERSTPGGRKISRKKEPDKGIRKKIQKILSDFIGDG